MNDDIEYTLTIDHLDEEAACYARLPDGPESVAIPREVFDKQGRPKQVRLIVPKE